MNNIIDEYYAILSNNIKRSADKLINVSVDKEEVRADIHAFSLMLDVVTQVDAVVKDYASTNELNVARINHINPLLRRMPQFAQAFNAWAANPE